jgi:Tol biopolymer transport system component
MGEVFRARDERLGRDVAIKVLPAALSRDEDRLRRFTQEARTIATLNHPNILAIYDVGTEDGSPYLVSELLQGATLREKLAEGPLPVRKALDYGRQIANGLAAAHEKGVIHRDLKPENIFVTSDGHVKLLDFGLAKLTARTEDDATRTEGTAAGAVLGTAGYMSPEQVRGQALDHRSDIFSFGVVLYEMLSGVRAFAGESSVEVMNAILKQEPPELKVAPGGVGAVVEHCLQKNPAERFQSARDLAFALAALCNPSQSQALAAVPGSGWRSRRTALYLALALLAVNAAVLVWWMRTSHAVPAMNRVGFQRLTDFVGLETAPAISPDGRSVAFTADAGGVRQIWVHLTAGGAPLQLTHEASDHVNPRWSQDSASILYYAPPREGEGQGAVWEISALGGPPRRLASALTEADVSHDGTRLAFFRLENGQTQLVVTDRDGSHAQPLGHFSSYNYAHPRWSPDDRNIAFEHSVGSWVDDLYVIASTGGDIRQVTHDGALIKGLAWLPDSSGLVFSSARKNTVMYLPLMQLWRQRLDGGDPEQLTFGDASYDYPDVGRDGRVLASRWRMQFDVWKYPVEGDAAKNAREGVRITAQTGQVQTPTISPDESEVAFLSDSGGHGNIWIKNLRSGELRQVTHERDPGVVVGVPIWSPDGRSIAFASNGKTEDATVVSYSTVHPDGSDLRNPIKEGAWATWSPDSKWLYYSADSPTKAQARFDLLKVPAEGGTAQKIRVDGGSGPMLSPDGQTLYYVVPLPDVSGLQDYEVRKARPENGPSTVLLKIAAQRVPVWQGLHPVVSHNGKWLALPLNDDYGTNLWLLSTEDGKLRRVVDFGERRTFIARRVSWSRDDRAIYAAVGEGDADVVSLDGLLR